MSSKIYIGDLAVFEGEPPDGNPYRGESVMGYDRLDALKAFKAGTPPAGITYWFTPNCGGARRVTDPAEVDWASSGV
jgi:hypothetical protein